MEGRGEAVAADDWTRGPEQIAPIVTWLASKAGSAWSGQIVNVMRGTIGIMQQPAIIRSFQSDQLWTRDDLDRVMPAMLDAKRAHDLRAKREGEPEAI
ncbi:MAG: hypothetical protein H6Q91_2360 [Deltaproteobacteria bacterium]|nr:hypothetical protein [Deltaproteobacteria bacterium]